MSWMKRQGLPSKGSLAVQRISLVDKLQSTFNAELEDSIVKSLDFSTFLHGNSTLVSDLTQGKRLKASFDTGDAKIVKNFDTVAQATDWLLTMLHSHKAGELDKGLRTAGKAVAPAVKLAKAASSVEGQQNGELTELMGLDKEKPNGSSEAPSCFIFFFCVCVGVDVVF